ncbi:MAG: hypothetical protein FJ090_04290 [Deltaproteobacteria bacterium]|nr:hypothetical protein [Deltaproteobacteria bacterium]
MLPARGEFALGRAFVEAVAAEHELPYVVSNLECGTPLPWPAVIERAEGGVNFAIYGVVSGELSVPACRAFDPARALASAPSGDTVVVVLSDQEEAQDLALAKAVPAIDFIVVADAASPFRVPEPLPNGGLRLSNGSRGKMLGVLRGELAPGASAWRDAGTRAAKAAEVDSARARLSEVDRRIREAADDKARGRLSRQREFWQQRLAKLDAELAAAVSASGPAHQASNELVALGDDVGEHPRTHDRVQQVKATVSGATPMAQGMVEDSEPPPAYTGAFVGSEACAGCHPVERAQWQGTAHARAWASLEAASRQFDSDCWSCHATGAFSPEGPGDPRSLGSLVNVGCESCHGAGRDHVLSPAENPLVANPPTSQCTQCHDKKQDDGRFDEATYRPRVVHSSP